MTVLGDPSREPGGRITAGAADPTEGEWGDPLEGMWSVGAVAMIRSNSL